MSLADSTGWTEPAPLDGVSPASPRVWAEILDGGQAFRWRACEGGWRGVFGDVHARLLPRADDGLLFSAPAGADPEALRKSLMAYLDGNGDPEAAADALPWRSDPRIAEARAAFPGLRILRQPFADALIGFICSSNANLPRIRAMVESLARNLGDEISPDVFRLPSWSRLAAATDAELAPCKLGYRAGFLRGAAACLAADPEFARRAASASPEAARKALTALPGVGPKVADCVRLFGLGASDAFPVDTWIRRVMDSRYGLDSWSDAQVAHFAAIHFGRHAGLAQQFLFAHARANPG